MLKDEIKKEKKNQFKNFAKEKEITIKNEGGLNHKKINFKESQMK
jgi:hypothetical protein